MNIQVKNLDHLGIVAGIIDQIGLVEEIDRQIEQHPQQIISTGQVVKAMILNGLGFVSAPLYLFSEFFVGKATEHLLGEGVKPEHLNDDRMGRALDSLSHQGLTTLFTSIAMLAHQRFSLSSKSLHLDSSSFSLYGEYEIESSEESSESIGEVKITYGYSKDHRPDLKQFMIDVICTGDGDIPMFVRIGDGNESDRAIFAQLMKQFKQEWNLDSIYVADSALYSAANLQQLGELNWITLVPRSIKTAKVLAESIKDEVFVKSAIPGYRIASCCCDYGGVHQRWLIIESKKRLDSDLKQLERRLAKQRVAALAMVMGLCLLVYTLGQRQLRQALAYEEETIPNQLKKPTSTPTLRWVFQCFQSIHLVHLNHKLQVSNLTDARLKILRLFGNPCQKYYLIC